MSKVKQKTNWKRIAYITLIWVIISILQALYEHLIFTVHNVVPRPEFQLHNLLLTNILAGLIAGITGGYILVKYMVPWFFRHPFGKALILLVTFYTLVFIIVVLSLGTIANIFLYEENKPLSDLLLDPFRQADIWYHYFFWVIINTVTLIGVFISDKYGPGVFGKFLMGKYFRPKRKERIFMFLDVRGSTTIVERLGEEKYFAFIKAYFTSAGVSIFFSPITFEQKRFNGQ